MRVRRIAKLIYNESPRRLWNQFCVRNRNQRSLQTFDDRHPCVFVLSTGRAGTETLAALFGLTQEAIVHHQPSPSLQGLSKLAYECSPDPFSRKVLGEAFLVLRNELLNTSLDYGRGYVETGPHVTFLARTIVDVLPSARFIHLVRDPREVVRSGMRRKWFEGHPNDRYRIVPSPSSEHGRKWEFYSPFQKNLWLWAETNRWISQFLTTVPSERRCVVRSEDLFSAHENTIRDLFDFIGAPAPERRRVVRMLGRRLNAQRSGIFPEAGDWTSEMNGDLDEIAGAVATELGYELSSTKKVILGRLFRRNGRRMIAPSPVVRASGAISNINPNKEKA